jgi:Zn-dependent membrane protease YugP
MSYWIIIGVFALLGWIVQGRLKSKFKQYSQVPIGKSGKEVAEQMLRDHGITDVKVISVAGQLTDHYNPQNRTVNLSEWVYGQRTVAAAAVAAHEVGHAVQHATAYSWLQMRSKMVPAVQFSSNMLQWILMAGIALMAFQGNTTLLLIGVILMGVTTLFSFVTLPVEFDASRRAMAWIGNAGVTTSQQNGQARDALNWAAMTYVVAALAALAQLAYWVMVLMSSRD